MSYTDVVGYSQMEEKNSIYPPMIGLNICLKDLFHEIDPVKSGSNNILLPNAKKLF